MQKVFLVYHPKDDTKVGISIKMWHKMNPSATDPYVSDYINELDYALAGAVNATDAEMVFMMTQKGQAWSDQTTAQSFSRSTAVGDLIAEFDDKRKAIGDNWWAVEPTGFGTMRRSVLYADMLEWCSNE